MGTAVCQSFLMMRRTLVILLCAAVVAAIVVVAAGNGSSEPQSAGPAVGEQVKQLEGAPAPLASLHRQASQLIDGGVSGFKQRLAGLRGYPVVVNKWAAWCGPCRQEFPHFQRLALQRGKKVAFLGVDSNDNDGEAQDFLKKYPVSYPSYKDPDLEIAAVFKGVQAFPSTAFYDSKGELVYLKQGYYQTEDKLAADIARYAK
jgi:cytochrome c biogenesis protein CcmG, thiol:disulfide interchange protein DsbE